MIHFSCPHCKTGLKTGNGSGKVARCPNCLELVEVPKSFGQSAPIPRAEEPAAGPWATTASTSPPKQAPETQGPQKRRLQRKTNFLLLGLAIAGLACAGFMIVDFLARGDSSNKAARSFKPRILTNPPMGLGEVPATRGPQGPTPLRRVPPIQPPTTQAEEGKAKAQVPVGHARLRLGRRPGEFGPTLAISPGGRILASCGFDGQIRLWDVHTGVLLKRLDGTRPLQAPGTQTIDNSLTCVALSRDGRRLAAGTRGGIVIIWEVTTGKELGAWQIDRHAVQLVAFSPDGLTLACSGSEGGTLLSELSGATKLRRWSSNYVRAFAFSPDGKMLAACDGRGGPQSPVMLLDLGTGEQRWRPEGGMALAFSPDGRILEGATALAFSPDGKTLAVSGFAGALRLWELATDKYLQFDKRFAGRVSQLAFSPDGKTLVSLSSEVRLWDVGTSEERCVCQGAAHLVAGIAFSDDGKELYTVGQDTIRRWDTATGKELGSEAEQGAVTAVAISSDGKTAATAGMDGTIYTWDLRTGQLARRHQGYQWPVQCLAYSPDGRLLASAAADRRESDLRLWDANTGKELRRLGTDTLPVSQVRFLPGGKLLAAVEGLGGRVHVWETVTSAEVHQLGSNRAAFSAFSPDATLLALWQQGSVCVWDVAKNELTCEFRPKVSAQDLAPGSGLATLALSPGGRHLAYATRNEGSTIHVLNTATGEKVDLHSPRGSAVRPQPWREMVSTLAWSHDGKTLACGCGDGQIWLWDLATTSARRCEGHEGHVSALAFSSDDRTLVSRSGDMTALVWDLTGLRDGSGKQPEQKR